MCFIPCTDIRVKGKMCWTFPDTLQAPVAHSSKNRDHIASAFQQAVECICLHNSPLLLSYVVKSPIKITNSFSYKLFSIRTK